MKAGRIKVDFIEDEGDLVVKMDMDISHKGFIRHHQLLNEYYDVIEKAINSFHIKERSRGETITEPSGSQENN